MQDCDCQECQRAEPAHDQRGLRLGLRALRCMAHNGWLDVSRIADGCAMDVQLALKVVGLFEEMGYARQLPSGASYALTPAGRQLAASLEIDRQSGALH